MQLFLDLDGTLADFDSLAADIFGMPSREFERINGSPLFWKKLREHGSFFEELPLLPDAMDLWDACKHLNPVILTGCPRGGWAEPQKRKWVAKTFGDDTQIITCRSKEKRNHFVEGLHNVIVDDWHEYKHLWEEHGGTFILHTSAEDSIKQLESIGLL